MSDDKQGARRTGRRPDPSRQGKSSKPAGPRPPDARRVALDILSGVLDGGHMLDEVRDANTARTRLDARDRGFVDTLTAVTLGKLGLLDAVIARFVDKAPRGKAGATAMHALRLGAAQLLFLNVAPHAAAGATVSLLDKGPAQSLKGLVNAVLRRISTEGEIALGKVDPIQALPDWAAERWSHAYGKDAALRVASLLGDRPPLDLSTKTDPQPWAAQLDAQLLPGGTLRLLQHGAVPDLPGYGDGAWWVQDAAAALPARLLRAKPGETALDLCAAPGGKTAQLAATGAAVTALEISPRRLDRLRQNLARLNLSAELLEADAAVWQAAAPFDKVLLDAPCSATGTIRKHPELLHIKSPQEWAGLPALQDRLLDNAATLTAPGGLLVYAVCSLEPEEGPDRAIAFLARHTQFTTDPIGPAEVPGFEAAITAEGWLRTLPFHGPDGGADGFFIARFRRTA